MNTSEPSSLHARLLRISCDLSHADALEPAVALPRVYASCRRVHWPSVVALPEHTALSSCRLPTLELDAVASLFKARCADPSPHRCLKYAPALPSPPYLDNQQSTRVHPVALNLLPPPLCANRCRASLQAKRALLPPLCSLVSTASAHCPFLTPFVRREQASHRSFCLSSAATPSLSQPSFLVKFLVHTHPPHNPTDPFSSLPEQARASPSTTDELPSPPKALARGQPASSLFLNNY